MGVEFAEENDIHLFEGAFIDLREAVAERILLEIPIQIIADEDVQGEAPPSGEGWSIVTEEDKKKQIDPRLADLANFFKDKDS